MDTFVYFWTTEFKCYPEAKLVLQQYCSVCFPPNSNFSICTEFQRFPYEARYKSENVSGRIQAIISVVACYKAFFGKCLRSSGFMKTFDKKRQKSKSAGQVNICLILNRELEIFFVGFPDAVKYNCFHYLSTLPPFFSSQKNNIWQMRRFPNI